MKPVRTILSISFVLLVLFSSSSFMIGLHLCGGNVQNIALFTKADECEMEKRIPPCHKHKSKPCCEDETIVHQGENFKLSSAEITTSPLVGTDIELPVVIISEVVPSTPFAQTNFYAYDPPLRSPDLTVSLQVFLI